MLDKMCLTGDRPIFRLLLKVAVSEFRPRDSEKRFPHCATEYFRWQCFWQPWSLSPAIFLSKALRRLCVINISSHCSDACKMYSRLVGPPNMTSFEAHRAACPKSYFEIAWCVSILFDLNPICFVFISIHRNRLVRINFVGLEVFCLYFLSNDSNCLVCASQEASR